jgi:hypothetical protein
MQFRFIITTSLISVITIAPALVSAEQMVRFIFNNGVEPSSPQCTSTDKAKIDALFVNRRRRLSMSNETVARELFSYPQKCKENCVGYKCCFATGCLGYDGTIKRNRKLQTVCDSVLSSINQKLDALAVSSTCKTFLQKSKRKGECYDDVRYGEVVGAKLWTITSSGQTSQDIPASGLSFCRSKYINIQAIGNTCVEVFGFDLFGPNGYKIEWRYEKHPPYAIFGDDGVSKFNGEQLPSTGTYYLTLKPDNFTDKQKKYTFTVNNC